MSITTSKGVLQAVTLATILTHTMRNGKEIEVKASTKFVDALDLLDDHTRTRVLEGIKNSMEKEATDEHVAYHQLMHGGIDFYFFPDTNIQRAFTWANTEEGWDFWAGVNNFIFANTGNGEAIFE